MSHTLHLPCAMWDLIDRVALGEFFRVRTYYPRCRVYRRRRRSYDD